MSDASLTLFQRENIGKIIITRFNLSIQMSLFHKGGYENKQIFHNETLLDYITNLPTQGDGLCSSSYLRSTHE